MKEINKNEHVLLSHDALDKTRTKINPMIVKKGNQKNLTKNQKHKVITKAVNSIKEEAKVKNEEELDIDEDYKKDVV